VRLFKSTKQHDLWSLAVYQYLPLRRWVKMLRCTCTWSWAHLSQTLQNFGKCLLGISGWEKRVPFATSSIRGSRGTPCRLKDRERYGTGDKNNIDEKCVNVTQVFHLEVSTWKTGLPFPKFRLFRKISSGTSQKVVFHLHPNDQCSR